MSVTTTPPPAPPKKRGLGCLGCGCLVLALLVILFVGLVAGACYLGYAKIVSLSSATATAVPSAEGGDDLYRATQQKLADFDHDVKNHQAATIQLNADEINSVIARSPDAINNNIHAFVTLTNNEIRLQASRPTDGMSHGLIKNRYFNFDVSFEVHFDRSTKHVNLVFQTLKLGDKVLLGPGADNDQAASSASFNQSFVPTLLNQTLNTEIRKNPDGAALLDQAKSIEVKDGELVIETQ